MTESHLGREALRDLYDLLQVDDEWATWADWGFTWWPYKVRQLVAAGEPEVIDSVAVSRVHVQVPIAARVPPDARLFELLAGINRFAPLFAVVYDERDASVSHMSAASVHMENRNYVHKLLGTSAALQVAVASASTPETLAAMYGGEPDIYSHPLSGSRAEPDDMLNAHTVYRLTGASSSVKRDHFVAAVEPLRTHVGIELHLDGPSASMSFPGIFTDVRCSISVEQHPSLGYGLLSLLRASDPIGPNADRVANDLNTREFYEPHAETKRQHFFGAWTTRDQELYFATFVPEIHYAKDIDSNAPMTIVNLAIEAGARAAWAMWLLSERFKAVTT